MQVTIEENSNPDAVLAISKGVWAVKHCSIKIPQFLTGVPAIDQVVAYNGHKTVVDISWFTA